MDSDAEQAKASRERDAAPPGPSLLDILERAIRGRFSGCVEVESDARHGLVFLRTGQVIHADEGRDVGEDALLSMASWPAGRFSVQANIETTRTTIRRGWELLRAEVAAAMPPPAAAAPVAAAPVAAAPVAAAARPPMPVDKPAVSGAPTERLRAIPGVAYAVLQTKEGQRVGDQSPQGEKVAGQALYLSQVAKQLGAVFGAGELQSAAVQGTTHHFLLLATKSHYLSVLGKAESRLGALESEVRRALSENR